MIEAVVFDMDGVIFDSETLLIDGWVAATKAMAYQTWKKPAMPVWEPMMQKRRRFF